MPDITITSRKSKAATKAELKKALGQVSKNPAARNLLFGVIAHDLFRTNFNDMLRKSQGGADRFGQRWKPLAAPTIASKAGIPAFSKEKQKQLRDEVTKVVMQRLRFRSGLTKEKKRSIARNIANKTVRARSRAQARIGIRTGDMFKSMRPGGISNSGYSPVENQLYIKREKSFDVGSQISYSKHFHKVRRIMMDAKHAKRVVKTSLADALPKLARNLRENLR